MTDEQRFGFSLELDDGDMVVENNTLALLSGKANLLQALELRVLTPYGSDPFNTNYGLDVTQVFTQPGTLRQIKELIKLNLVRTLGTDPRVREIREILFTDDPDYLARHQDVTPKIVRERRNRRLWQVEVTFETVDGQTETLPVTIGV